MGMNGTQIEPCRMRDGLGLHPEIVVMAEVVYNAEAPWTLSARFSIRRCSLPELPRHRTQKQPVHGDLKQN